jgi:hypothetical protein
MFRFVSALAFSQGPDNLTGPAPTAEGNVIRRNMESFMLAFDTNLAPIVGQQVTLTRAAAAAVNPRIDLLIARANAGECDLVAKTFLGDREIGFLYTGGGKFASDRKNLKGIPDSLLRQLSSGAELTYTCTPLGSGRRIGIDRDEDGFLDGDERDAASNPANPASTP